MSFVDDVIALAQKVLPVISGAAGPYVTMAVAAANAVTDLVRKVKETAGEDDQAKLQAILDELEQRVQAHADATIGRLGGE